jgi:O-antigen ligase
MWLELGAVGTTAVVIFLVRAFRNATVALANSPSKFARWNCAIVFLSLLGAINGDKFMYPDTMVWVFFVLAYTNLANEVRRTRAVVNEARQVAWAS